MHKTHSFLALLLLAAGMSALIGCAPVPAIEETPTDEPTVEPTDVPTPTATNELTATPTQRPTRAPSATATLITQNGFTPISSDPILETDSRYMDPGAVVYHEGEYHIFANDFDGWPARVDIIHGVSTDGVNWQQPSAEPILNENDVPYARLAILASSALVQADGTWVLYFYTWDSVAPTTTGSIGRATAPAPEGPWTADPTPALEPGPDGAWDHTRIATPSVVQTGDGYAMYYSAGNVDTPWIGMATSADGLTWTKHNDPATNDAALAQSDPVMRPAEDSAAWDSMFVRQPNVIRTADGYAMLYKGGKTFGSGDSGLAFSEDGVTWTRHANNPLFRPSIIRGGSNIWFTNMLVVDGRFHIFIEVGKGSRTRVYIIAHEGNFEH